MFTIYSPLSLLILILDIIAIVAVLRSRLDPVMKLIWILIILVLPLIGMILWFLLGNKKI